MPTVALEAPPYKATRDLDGKYTIEGVEIFGVLPKGERNNDRKIGKAWHEAVIAYHAKREREDGYRPPIHIKHHGFAETQRAGFFRPTHVAQVPYKGKMMWALFATFYKIPADVFSTIQDHGLPYRSIEVLNSFDPEEPWISSVALLEDEEPYFSFRNLDGESIERLNFERGTFGDYADGDGPDVLYASSATGEQSAWLFSRFPRLEVSEPMSYTLTRKGSDVILLDSDGKQLHVFTSFESEDKKDEKIAKLQDEIKDLKAKLSRFESDESDDDDDKDEPKPVQAAAGGELVKMIGEQSGQLEKLTREVEDMRETSAFTTRVDGAVKSLKDDGFHVSDATRESIETFAKLGDKAMNDFIAAHKRTASRDPDADPTPAPLDEGDTVLAKFAQRGADALAKAREGDAHFRNLVNSGMYREDEREMFLNAHVGGNL